jgi:hypothetical protein
MSRRRLARPGLSYIEANSGRLVTESAELIEMKGRIRERWPNLDVVFDHEDRQFLVIQKLEDGSEHMFLCRPYCDERLMMDIAKADPTNRNYVDPIDAVDKHNESIERDRDRELEEVAGDFGERFIHALKKDGFYDHEDITGVKPKTGPLADRAIRRR